MQMGRKAGSSLHPSAPFAKKDAVAHYSLVISQAPEHLFAFKKAPVKVLGLLFRRKSCLLEAERKSPAQSQPQVTCCASMAACGEGDGGTAKRARQSGLTEPRVVRKLATTVP